MLFKKMIKSFLIFLFLIPLSSHELHAQVLFQPAINYLETERKLGGQGKTKDVQQIYNVSLAYLFGNGFHLGLKYFQANFSTESINSGGNVSTTTTTRVRESGYGLHAGYTFDNGFYLGLSYLFQDVQEKGPGYKFYDDHAEIIDLAYKVDLGDVAIGPQITISKFYYKKLSNDSGDQDLEGTWYTQRILPYFGLWWEL